MFLSACHLMHRPPCQYLRYHERIGFPISLSSCRYKSGQSLSTSLCELGIVVFHRLFLAKLIIAFSHSGKPELYLLVFRAFSVCQHKALLSCMTDWERSKWLRWRKGARYVKMLNMWYWYSEWKFTQKQEWKYFSNCCLSQICKLLARSRMAFLATMAPVERLSPSWAGSGGAVGCRDFTHLPSSFKRLVRTRWHCNNTCYITRFIYKITPTWSSGVILKCSKVSVFIRLLLFNISALLTNEYSYTYGYIVIKSACE